MKFGGRDFALTCDLNTESRGEKWHLVAWSFITPSYVNIILLISVCPYYSGISVYTAPRIEYNVTLKYVYRQRI